MPRGGKLPLIATAFLLVVLVGAVFGRQPSLCKRLTGPTPIMISAPGDYCLATNIDAPAGRPALIITADDVAIDFSAFSLSSPPSPDPAHRGIEGIGVERVTIENGAIRGLHTGIHLEGQRLAVHNMVIEQSAGRGVLLSGNDSALSLSTIRFIGQAGIEPMDGPVHVHGAALSGRDARVLGNTFIDIYGNNLSRRSEGVALALSGNAENFTVNNNVFIWSDACRPNSPSQYGV